MPTQRSRQLCGLAAKLKREELEKHIGSSCAVLWERQINPDAVLWFVYTPHFHRIVSDAAHFYKTAIIDVSVDQLSSEGLTLVSQCQQAELQDCFRWPDL